MKKCIPFATCSGRGSDRRVFHQCFAQCSREGLCVERGMALREKRLKAWPKSTCRSIKDDFPNQIMYKWMPCLFGKTRIFVVNHLAPARTPTWRLRRCFFGITEVIWTEFPWSPGLSYCATKWRGAILKACPILNPSANMHQKYENVRFESWACWLPITFVLNVSSPASSLWNSIPQVSISCVLSACAGAGYWELAFQCLNELMPRSLDTKISDTSQTSGNVASPFCFLLHSLRQWTRDDCGKLETKLQRFWISIFELQWTDFAWGWVLPMWYKSGMIRFSWFVSWNNRCLLDCLHVDGHLLRLLYFHVFRRCVKSFEHVGSNQMDALAAWK